MGCAPQEPAFHGFDKTPEFANPERFFSLSAIAESVQCPESVYEQRHVHTMYLGVETKWDGLRVPMPRAVDSWRITGKPSLIL